MIYVVCTDSAPDNRFNARRGVISYLLGGNQLYSTAVVIRLTRDEEISVAKQKYLRVAPIPGKFYVSEGWRAGNTEGEEVLSQFDHGNKLAQLVLAGPYDTRGEAEHWNTNNARGHAEIWQF